MRPKQIHPSLFFSPLFLAWNHMIPGINGFVSKTSNRLHHAISFSQGLATASKTSVSMGFLDDLFKSSSSITVRKPNSSPKVEVPPGFQIPEPKPLALTPSSDVPTILKSSVALTVRLATGVSLLGIFNVRDSSSVLQNAPRPEEPLILYEYDASPYCKRVREIINILDLTVEYRPCPGARQSSFSTELKEMTGKQTVPYLVDPNKNISMFESNDIINYLVSTYGPVDKSTYDTKALWPVTFEPFSIFTSTIAAILCELPGSQRQENARPDNEEMIPLELWGYECSPFVKPVRGKLCSLALPHKMISCSRGSKNRDLLFEKTGRFQVPYLVDPNTGIEMFESAEICQYLDDVYTVKE